MVRYAHTLNHGSFNPRAREGRDIRGIVHSIIHCSFNPRAREGRDKLPSAIGHDLHKFQSTRPRRARLVRSQCGHAKQRVSIHAPAKGATAEYIEEYGALGAVSIHAPAKGATERRAFWDSLTPVSIHAPAKGATWLLQCLHPLFRRFNPRAREGRDGSRVFAHTQDNEFQSTRPRRARHVCVLHGG